MNRLVPLLAVVVAAGITVGPGWSAEPQAALGRGASDVAPAPPETGRGDPTPVMAGNTHRKTSRRLALAASMTAPRALPPETASAARLAAHAQARALSTVDDPAVKGRWRELGPKPFIQDDPEFNEVITGFDVVAGRMTGVAVDPRNPDLVYAGAAGGGVWRSTDAGEHWTPVFDHMPSLAIGDVAVGPDGTVFAGTGEANTNMEGLAGTGVYRSRDRGTTWQRVPANLRTASTVFRIEIAPGPAGAPYRVFVATNRGLFRSTDAGDSYVDVRLPTNPSGTSPGLGPFDNVVSDVRVKPGTPEQVTAAVGWRAGRLNTAANGLYRSTTSGAPGSFSRMATVGLGAASLSGDPLGRMSLAYARGPGQDHDVMWAVVQDAGRFRGETFVGVPAPSAFTVLNGVYQSSDDGATWTLKATAPQLMSSPGAGLLIRGALLYGPGVQSWYNQFIAVDPGDADVVVLGLEEIYQTVGNANGPGPAAWRTIGRYDATCPEIPADLEGVRCRLEEGFEGHTTHPDQHAVAFTTKSGRTRMFVGGDGGVYRQDAGPGGYDNNHWTSLNDTLGTTQPYGAAMSGDGTVYAGFQDNGTGRTMPSGRSVGTLGGDGFETAVHPTNPELAWTELPFGDLYRTASGGRRWSSIGPPVTRAQFSTPFELDPANARHMVVGARQIFETATADAVGSDDWGTAYDLGASPNGIDWSTTALGVVGRAVYAGFCGVCDVINEAGGDATKFRNGLATNVRAGCEPATGRPACWHVAAAKNLPNRFISDIAVDPTEPSRIWVTLAGYARRWYPPPADAPGVGVGHVFLSTDAGETFTDISSNLPDTPATSIVVRRGRLFVGTDTGLFTAASSGAPFERLGTEFPDAPAWDVSLDPDGSTLLVATHGRGVWAYDFPAPSPPAPPAAAVSPRLDRLPATGAVRTPLVAVLVLFCGALIVGTTRRRVARP